MKVSIAIEHLIYRLAVFCLTTALVARQKWSLSCRDARAERRERLGIRAKLSDQQNGQDRLHEQGKQQEYTEASRPLRSIQQAGTTSTKHSGHGDRPSRESCRRLVIGKLHNMHVRIWRDRVRLEGKKSSCYSHMQGIFLCT